MTILADVSNETVVAALDKTAVVSTLDGVTTAMVAFVLVGLVYPRIIKKRQHFFAIVGVVMAIILFHALALMMRATGFTVFTGVLTGLLQIAGIGLAVMSTGGLGAKELAGELSRSYEVMRRGEETKEVIIPIGMNKKSDADAPVERVVYNIDTPPGPAGKPASPGDQSIPLEE